MPPAWLQPNFDEVKALISGAGIAGLATGIALRQAGHEVTIQHMSVCTWRGRQVNDYPLESVAARFGFQPVFVHRADLQAALARRFGTERLLFDAVVSGFKQDGAEVQVTMRDGTTVMSTRLVGSKDCGKRPPTVGKVDCQS